MSGEIVLGGGCFWCTEAVFKKVDGVKSVRPGYAGGTTENPSYEEVSTGKTGHAEVVKLEYDPDSIKLEKILDVFFQTHDPTTRDRQGPDTGSQYRSIVLYTSDGQREIVERVIESLRPRYEDEIVTEVEPLEKFWTAEERHQNYFEKNPDSAYCRIHIPPKIEKAQDAQAER